MTEISDIISHYNEVRARLISPPNAVLDKGINLHPTRIPPKYPPLIPIPAVLGCQVKSCKVSIKVIHRIPIPEIKPRKVKLDCIIKAVCKHFEMPRSIIKGISRKKYHVLPRHIIFYLACCHTELSLPQIARKVGRQDHTSIMHGRDRIKERLLVDEELKETVKLLEYKIFSGFYEPGSTIETKPESEPGPLTETKPQSESSREDRITSNE